MRFSIVTPTLQSELYLNETIQSVLFQAGDFDIRYIVRDGGSTDNTAKIVRRWQDFLKKSRGLVNCKSVELIYETGSDTGMYDALNKAFYQIADFNADVMTWINSDDILAPGALATVASVFEQFSDVGLVGGRAAWLNGNSQNMGIAPLMGFGRAFLRAGLHDGRRLPFVMQEGTFWRKAIWDQVGGLNPALKLAGDWDLWRRMSAVTDYTAVDALTAYHRRRPGQLSGNIEKYYNEIDALLDESGRDQYEALFKEYQEWNHTSGSIAIDGRFRANILKYRQDLQKWTAITSLTGRGKAPTLYSGGVDTAALRGQVVDGMGSSEGPYPEFDLPVGVRWIIAPKATVSFDSSRAGRYYIRLQCRSVHNATQITIRSGQHLACKIELNASLEIQNQEIVFPVVFSVGKNDIEIHTELTDSSSTVRLMYIDAIAWHVDVHRNMLPNFPSIDLLSEGADGDWKILSEEGGEIATIDAGSQRIQVFSQLSGLRKIKVEVVSPSEDNVKFRSQISGVVSRWASLEQASDETKANMEFEGFFAKGNNIIKFSSRDGVIPCPFTITRVEFHAV